MRLNWRMCRSIKSEVQDAPQRFTQLSSARPPPSCIGFPRWPPTVLSQLPPGHTAQAATAAHPLVRKALRYAAQLKKRWPIVQCNSKRRPRRGIRTSIRLEARQLESRQACAIVAKPLPSSYAATKAVREGTEFLIHPPRALMPPRHRLALTRRWQPQCHEGSHSIGNPVKHPATWGGDGLPTCSSGKWNGIARKHCSAKSRRGDRLRYVVNTQSVTAGRFDRVYARKIAPAHRGR